MEMVPEMQERKAKIRAWSEMSQVARARPSRRWLVAPGPRAWLAAATGAASWRILPGDAPPERPTMSPGTRWTFQPAAVHPAQAPGPQLRKSVEALLVPGRGTRLAAGGSGV